MLQNKKKGLKVLYIIHQFLPEHYRGTEKFTLNLATHIKKLGHHVRVLTMSSYDDATYREKHGPFLLNELTYNNIPITAIKRHVDYWERFTEDPQMVELAKALLIKEQPDIVHVAHTIKTAEFVTAIKELDIPYILTMTDFFLICHHAVLSTSGGQLCYGPEQGNKCIISCPELGEGEIRKRYQRAKEILFGAKKVIAPSRFLAKLFQEEFPELHVDVINYGVDPTYLKKNTKKYTKNSSLTFCYAGSIDHHKGVDLLLEGFSRIKSKDIALILYGSGNDELKKMYRDKRIKFCGVYDEGQVGDIFSNVDLLIVPSVWHENRPQVITEALACQLPVLASDAGGIEQITDGANGFTFSMGNKRDLTKKLQMIIKNPEVLNKVKAGISRTRILTAEKEAIEYERVYQAVTRGPK